MSKKILPRPGVGVMLMNEKAEVLLGKRSDDPSKTLLHGENTWTLPGGSVIFRESLRDCAIREVLEETGIKLGALNPISISDEIVHDAHFVCIGFLCREFEGEPQPREPDEITEWKWFPLKSLPDKMFLPSKGIIENYMNKKLYNGD